MSSTYRLIVVGAGGHARAVISVIQETEAWDVACVVDLNYSGADEEILGVGVTGDLNRQLSHFRPNGVFIAVGDNTVRAEVWQRLQPTGVELPAIISESAVVAKTAVVGPGSFVAPLAFVGPECVVGENCIVNSGAVFEHESKLGSHAHLGPQSTVAGRCELGDFVFLGMGACVLPNLEIRSETTIGANATVTRSIQQSGIYVGTPARRKDG